MSSLKAISNSVDSQTKILSPAVGFYSSAPNPESLLTPGAFIGKLQILNTEIELYLPENVGGKVEFDGERDKIYPVEYKQELFRLIPENIDLKKETIKAAVELKEKQEKGFVLRASTTGIFYCKPSPDAPPYVELGQQIESGKVVGLIEVMKTFNQVVFQGTDKSETGKITQILVEDTAEVKLGDALFVVE
ncbi:MAG: biotin/lipoyl-containing protein [bacterium]|nr:biotin/lipoyl-containing protein [bacterium]